MKETLLYHELRRKENPTLVEKLFVEQYRKIGSVSEILVEESKMKYEPSDALNLIRETL